MYYIEVRDGKMEEGKNLRLILFYTIQQVMYPTFDQISKSLAQYSWEIFDTNFPMYYIGVRDGKMEKEGKN